MDTTALRAGLPASQSRPYAVQATFVALLLNELVAAWQQHPGEAPETLPAWRRLADGIHACGFVCRDVPPRLPHLEPWVLQPGQIRHASFPALRRCVGALVQDFAIRGQWHVRALQAGLPAELARQLCEEAGKAR